MTTWPISLPQAPLIGHTESAPDVTIRTSMDAGPDKLRRRFTAGVRAITFPLLLTDQQVDTLDHLYMVDLAGGALRFDLTLPRTGALVQYRFTAPPEYTLVAPTKWQAVLRLEVLP